MWFLHVAHCLHENNICQGVDAFIQSAVYHHECILTKLLKMALVVYKRGATFIFKRKTQKTQYSNTGASCPLCLLIEHLCQE